MDMYRKRKMRKEKKEQEIKVDVIQEKSDKLNINWYPGHMAKTKRLVKEQLDLIDVVYEVIDARMPYSSKIKDLDEIIKNKPRILIMTKTDLCDMNETKKWMKYYEGLGYKVLGLNLEGGVNLKELIKATEDIMFETNQKRIDKGMKVRRTRILIIGIPNVGKSTLINRLVGKKATNVGNQPGVTKHLNWIRINENLELLDTPGILWPKFDEEIVALNLASLTAIKEEILPLFDVTTHILAMLEKYYNKQLEERYSVTELDEDIIVTYDIIGKKRGCLIKGGEIDYDKVINAILNDVKSGLIKNITFDRYEEMIDGK